MTLLPYSVRVLDLSRVLAGPLCSMILADLGAAVIKVERPGTGDETRGWGPPFDATGQSAYFLSINRNKLSIALDLENPADLAVLRSLMEAADVVLENFRPGTLERRGIQPAQLLARLPRLIWCTISGFGPGSDRPGYDFVAQAESGWMSITGDPGGEPVKTGVALADVIAGHHAAIAILGALAGREFAPGGLAADARRLHISLVHSAVASLVNVAQNVVVSGHDAGRWGNAHPNLVPYQLFRAADRHVVIAVGSDAQWRALCVALGLDALGADPALASNAGRVARREQVVGAITARIVTRSAAHWLGALDAVGVPCGVVRSVKEAVQGVPVSPVTGVAPAVPGSVRLDPPRLDAHGALIRAHGWDVFSHVVPVSPVSQER